MEKKLSGSDLIEYYEENEIEYDMENFSKEEIFEYASNNFMFDDPEWMRKNFSKEEILECVNKKGWLDSKNKNDLDTVSHIFKIFFRE
nr:hypothetical protein [Sulfurospirillum sp. 'SP']